MKIFTITTIASLLFSTSVFANTDNLKTKIEQTISSKKADVGISIYGIENKETLNINNNKYPMQSVFKFHIALAVLNEVDKGNLSLEKKLLMKKSDFLPKPIYSPLRDKYPNGNVSIPLSEILKYTISQSDNSGCDYLLKLIGGPKKVNDYIHQIGVKDVAIQFPEEEMQKNWNNQFKNWTTPSASTELLKIFYERKILSQKSYDYLWETMLGTTTGINRIKSQLPKGSLVAHKTGTSGINKGITAAINDIGIVTLPNGKHFVISVYVCNSKENEKTNEKIIADVAKLTSDYFTGKIK